MKFKGQIAFESLLVLLMIITAVMLITTLYLQYHEETIALGYAKIGALEEISKQEENVIIQKINLQRNGPIITIILSKNIAINTTNIENTIKANTSLANIQVNVDFVRQ